MQKQLQVQYLNTNTNTTVLGTTANYLDVRKYTIAAGKMFTEGDDRASRRVAVLGAAVPDNLGVPAATLVGQNVRIGGFLFEVIGVLASKGTAGGFGNPDDQVLIPITTAQFRVFGTDRLRSIGVLAPVGGGDPAGDGRDPADPAPRAQAASRHARRLPDPQSGRLPEHARRDDPGVHLPARPASRR